MPQIAMAWIFNQRALDVYALTAPMERGMMRVNVEASRLRLTNQECAWLDLEQER